MPRTAAAEKASVVEETVQQAPATKTNWDVFYDAKLVPTSIICQEYEPVHRAIIACHTKLRVDAAVMKNHIDADHGGGFEITLAHRDAPWEGWKELAQLGVELADFRCNVCDTEIRLTARSIHKHMQPHLSSNRKIERGGTFKMTLAMSLATFDSDLEDE